jgi:hypothetical protein
VVTPCVIFYRPIDDTIAILHGTRDLLRLMDAED